VLLVVASDSANFLTHVSSSARAKVSDKVIGETGKSLREQLGNSDFTAALAAGIKTFVDQLGTRDNFTFASLDPQGGETLVAVQERPRKVESPSAQLIENSQPTPAAVPTPSEITSGIACTMSKNSRMPDRGISRTCLAIKSCDWNGGAILWVLVFIAVDDE
jgi:hypothetical protein